MQEIQKGLTFIAILAGLVIFGWLLIKLSPVLAPFLLAALLAYLANPLVERLSNQGKYKIPRTVAVILVFVFMIAIVLLGLLYLIPMLHKQMNEFIEFFPKIIKWLQEALLPKLEAVLGLSLDQPDMQALQDKLIQHWSKATDLVTMVSVKFVQSGMTLINWLVNFFLVIVVAFYLLRDWHGCLKAVQQVIPQSYRSQVVGFVRKADEVMGSFLKGQLTVMLSLGVIYAVGLSIIGLKFSVMLGIGAGLLSIVPYLGSIVGIVAALLVALLTSHDWMMLLWVAVVFGVGQSIESMVLTPLLVGDKLGLHPVVVIFAVLAGGQLMGMVGILLAIPVAAILAVILREPVLEWAKRS